MYCIDMKDDVGDGNENEKTAIPHNRNGAPRVGEEPINTWGTMY